MHVDCPTHCVCPFCGRDQIVVDRHTGWRTPHRTKKKTQPGKKGPWCDGGNRHHTSTPDTAAPRSTP